jgi:hypothetical protein
VLTRLLRALPVALCLSAVPLGAAALGMDNRAMLNRAEWNNVELGSIDNDVFDLAFNAVSCAAKMGDIAAPPTLTIIDYSKPSTEQRLWVYDLRSRQLIFQELVAHGQGSGGLVPTAFSDKPDSHQTSIGLFTTDDVYNGKNGYSLRLDGLEPGFNSRARERAIVIHGAPYVSTAFASEQGRLGRSWGCPALREAVAKKLIDTVKGGGVVFSYYPDQRWLKTSKYLQNACN